MYYFLTPRCSAVAAHCSFFHKIRKAEGFVASIAGAIYRFYSPDCANLTHMDDEMLSPQTPPIGTMKILVAHRQKQTVEAIRSVLSSINSVLYTESGLDGLLTSRIEHFDVIICGTDLPVVTGFEMIRSLRTNSINRHTPVVFLTNETDVKILQLCRALNAFAVMGEDELVSQLEPLVREKVSCRPDQAWEPLSAPVRSLY